MLIKIIVEINIIIKEIIICEFIFMLPSKPHNSSLMENKTWNK